MLEAPEVPTHKQIAKTVCKVLNRPVRIEYIPIWTKNEILFFRTFTSVRMYGPIEFLMTVLTMDMVASQPGSRKLEKYFTGTYEAIKNKRIYLKQSNALA